MMKILLKNLFLSEYTQREKLNSMTFWSRVLLGGHRGYLFLSLTKIEMRKIVYNRMMFFLAWLVFLRAWRARITLAAVTLVGT